MAAKKICFASIKGGVGKSTLAISTINFLAAADKRVLAVELDPQNSLTSFFVEDEDNYVEKTTYHALTGYTDINECILNVDRNIDVIPSDRSLLRLNNEMISTPDKEYLLQEKFGDLKTKYDYIVMDTAPTLNLETMLGIASADLLVIPVQLNLFSIKDVDLLFSSAIMPLKKRVNPDLQVKILVNFYVENEFYTSVLKILKDNYGKNLIKGFIRKSSSIDKHITIKKELTDRNTFYQDLSIAMKEII